LAVYGHGGEAYGQLRFKRRDARDIANTVAHTPHDDLVDVALGVCDHMTKNRGKQSVSIIPGECAAKAPERAAPSMDYSDWFFKHHVRIFSF
jgi:hypothetical protein